MRVFDPCESGWVPVQRRRQRSSRRQGQKGKESEVKKASFVFSNRAFPVGKKASFNSVCSSGGCDGKRSSISKVFSVPGRSGILSTPASSCLDSNRSSSAVEGTFASELFKVAPTITGSVSQVRRVCDSADKASGTDPLRPGAGFCSAAAHAAAGAGEENSKNEVPECRPRQRVAGEEKSKNVVSECRLRRRVTGDPPGLALHATADESEGII